MVARPAPCGHETFGLWSGGIRSHCAAVHVRNTYRWPLIRQVDSIGPVIGIEGISSSAARPGSGTGRSSVDGSGYIRVR